MVGAREIFGPLSEPSSPPEGRAETLGVIRVVREFYRDRLAWLALAVTAFCAAYGGGAVMFWVHSVWLGEGGPDIPPVAHWALDSTAGMLGLTPGLAVILPLAAQLGRRSSYILTTGGVFTLLTVPGPIVHDALVARGTWVADQITQLLGPGGGPHGPAHDVSAPVSMTYQFLVGLPTYVVCIALATLVVRLIHRSGT